jgi:hypothetical protein
MQQQAVNKDALVPGDAELQGRQLLQVRVRARRAAVHAAQTGIQLSSGSMKLTIRHSRI